MAVIHAFDEAVLRFFQDDVRCAFLNPIMRGASLIGDMGLFWIVLCLVLIAFKRTRRGGFATLCSLAAEFCICDLIIKRIVQRPRPYLTLDWLELIVHTEASFSFPSGHSASSFACAYVLTRAFGKWGALSYIPATLIAVSRVYVGVHFPTDVLAGMALGTLVGAACWAAYKRFFEREKKGK